MATSRLASNAARYASYAARATAQQVLLAARSAASVGVDAAREAARINSYTVPTNVLSATDAGGGHATVSIADHSRVYPVQGDLDVPDLALAGVAALTGLANSTTYYLYYDDATLGVTAPVVHATTVPKDAQVGAAPGRHFLGEITTPAGGAGGTSGGGGFPPGGNGGNPIP